MKSKWRLWIAAVLLVGILPNYAQDSCHTELMDTFELPYQESGSMDQVKIWYDYARDAYVSANHTKATHRFQDAIKYYWKVIQNDKDGLLKVSYSRLTDSYRKLGRPDSALVVVQLGLKKHSQSATLHYMAGQLWKASSTPECAVPHYQFLAQQPGLDADTRKRYWAVLVNLYLQMEDERCVDAQQEIVNLDPQNAQEATRLAQLMEQFGFDAIEALETAWRINPQDPGSARRYGVAVYERGEYQKAVPAFQQVIDQSPENIEARSYLARSYEGLDQLKMAASLYRDILALKPNSINSLCALASVHGRQGQFARARLLINKAIKADPTAGLPHMVMGEIYENAVTRCNRSRDTEGYSYDDKLVFELAIREYGKAATKDPNYRGQGQRRVRDLAPLKRTIEDKHMHQRDTIKDPCYAWIGKS